MFFLLFLLDDRRIWISISDLWIRIRVAQKHMDPTDPDFDPDPQHWFVVKRVNFFIFIYRDS
jgi:hypothetical protein